MRRALVIVAALGAASLILGPPAAARQAAGEGVLLLVMPDAEARVFLADRAAAWALVVHPPSRDAAALLLELGTGAPPRPGEAGGEPGRVADLIGPGRGGAVVPAMRDDPAAAVLDAFRIEPGSIEDAIHPAETPWLGVVVVAKASDAVAVLRLRPWTDTLAVLGVGERTPVLFAADLGDSEAVYDGGQARRLGIATPYDVSRTLLTAFPVVPSGLAGKVLRRTPTPDAAATIGEVLLRIDRPTDVLVPLTAATAGAGVVLLLLGTAARARRRRRVVAACARAAAMLPAGYVGALFIGTDRWEVRATALFAAMIFGATFVVRDVRRFCGWAFVGTSAAVIALTFLAALDPNGTVANAIWGNPLTSWRFFGLKNHLASFAAGGVIVGIALLRVPWWGSLVFGSGVAVVLGAATLGANFIGVLTLGFGATVVVLVLVAGRPRWFHVPLASAAALGATMLALAVDAVGEPVSHGGAALDDIRSGGVATARAILADRWRLSLDEVRGIGALGWVALALVVVTLGALAIWSWRGAGRDVPTRAAVAGGAAAALAALVTEDSGMFTAGILGVFPWVAYLAWTADTWFRGDPAPVASPAPAPVAPAGADARPPVDPGSA